MRKPPRINQAFTARLHALAAEHKMEMPEGFQLFGCHRKRGRCDHAGRITVPCWAECQSPGFLIQYLAHEIAHAWAYRQTESWDHGPVFMEYMMILCPPEFWHYELNYKPRLAAAAGIARPCVNDKSGE